MFFPVWFTCRHLVFPEGKVVSFLGKKNKAREVSINITRNGYARVRIGKETIYFHKVMANCFLGPRPDGLQINHKDGNKRNNLPENLEYISPKENIRHSWSTGLSKAAIGEERRNSRFKKEEVLIMHRLYDIGLRQAEIGVIFKTNQRAVSAILNGTNWPQVKEIYEKHHRGINKITKRNKERCERCQEPSS